MTSIMRDKLGSGCMLLFALPFAAVGVGALGLIGWTLMTWASMQSWEERPARIEKAKLVVNRSSDSATYNVKAQYTYEWNGKTFCGDRVSIHTSNDNVGSFHKRTYEELENHRSRNEPFRCYVNPKEPSQAVLYRDMRIELLAFMLLFALTFGAAGFGLMGGALYAGRLHRETAALRRQYPDEPWRWKKPWNDGVIHSGKKMKMMGIIIFAFFWNVISMPVMFFVPGELRQGNTLALIALVFPAAGAVMIGVAVYFVLQWRRFGDVTFEMATVPGTLGGRLHGLIRIPNQILPERVAVSLDCVRRRTTGGGKSRHTSETILWQTEKTLARDALFYENRQTAVPVDFYMPCDQPGSDSSDPNDQIIWRLRARAPLQGVDFSASFDVPVFQTADTDPSMTTAALRHSAVVTVVDEDGHAITYYEPADAAETGERLRRAGIRTEPVPRGGVAFVSPMLRHPGLALGALFFLIIWGGVIAIMMRLDAPVIFPVVFGAFFLFMLYFVLDLWTGTRRVEVDRTGVRTQGGPFGVGPSRRLPFEDLADIDVEAAMQAGNTQYYTVVAKTQGGRKIRMINRLKNNEAQALVAALQTAANDYRQKPDAAPM